MTYQAFQNDPYAASNPYSTADPLTMALGGGLSQTGLGSGMQLNAASGAGVNPMSGLGGSYGTGDFTGPFEDFENTTDTTGYDITGTDTGLTPGMDTTDPPYDRDTTIYEPPITVTPRPKTDTTIYDLPPIYNPVTPIPTSPTEITSESYTPLATGSGFNFNFPQFNLPPMNFSPIGSIPEPAGGFYSTNSGAAGTTAPVSGQLPQNYLPDLVQALSGGPAVTNRVV